MCGASTAAGEGYVLVPQERGAEESDANVQGGVDDLPQWALALMDALQAEGSSPDLAGFGLPLI